MNEYEELFPHKNVNKSFKKFLDYEKNHTHSKAMGWLDRKRKNTQALHWSVKKSADGKNIAIIVKNAVNKSFLTTFSSKQEKVAPAVRLNTQMLDQVKQRTKSAKNLMLHFDLPR